ncbi:uncharacterized protein UV8b_06075 [Ustilaginoidea virens]|uniref:RRM domain-containing protein n=1 Tax=Ustilaginoidea virens TaxID=1159556 RepID=A0A8E5HUK8_USTVR|nr:uncharacterized protein UV8b_06075 [Ustilaginoidea virens]QUC21834.1 hypothetical protein UV8b_06075 [Ustilaginoidea virens]
MSFITISDPESVAWRPKEQPCCVKSEESSISGGQLSDGSETTHSTDSSVEEALDDSIAFNLLSQALRQSADPTGAVSWDASTPHSVNDHVDKRIYQTPVSKAAKATGDSVVVPYAVNITPSSPAGGLPASHSYQSVSTLMSPASAERPGGLYSGSGAAFTLTEPRNYAPRTSGMPVALLSEPPPRFDLSVALGTQPLQPAVGNGGGNASRAVAGSTVVPFVSHSHSPSAGEVFALRSDHLNRLTGVPAGLPTLQTALQPGNFPFLEGARQAAAVNYGVVKLKNIPFATKRAEVIAFLGRNSKILNDADEPVHIIMERVTSKTMDAYVEFVTLDEANKAVEKHHQHSLSGRVSRLGDRPVEVELSNQESLMRDLFPLARGVVWNGVTPHFEPFKPYEPWGNFKGFVSEEEMVMLVKHVEVPHRSPFSRDCPQRPYECLISTLKKFPWYATDRITISQRRAIFRATCELARLLTRSIQKQDDPINLTVQLRRRLLNTAMKCPGFTPLMKDDLAYMADLSEMEERQFNQPRFASCWRHQYGIAPKPGMPLDVVEWYIAVIREQTQRDVTARHHAERNCLQEKSAETDMYWGYFWAELGYAFGAGFDQMTLSQAADAEFTAIERILARALPSE